jgi:hypothetical protein
VDPSIGKQLAKIRYSKKIIIVVFFLLSACSLNFPPGNPTLTPATTILPELTDTRWLSDQLCRTPCWYGLTLGETSTDAARQIVSHLSFIDPTSHDGLYGSISYLSYDCKRRNSTTCVILRFENDTLVQISQFPENFISFRDLVDKIGQPDNILTIRQGTRFVDCTVSLVWVDRQISANYFEDQRTFGRDLCGQIMDAGMRPNPALEVQNITIDMSGEILNMINESYSKPWKEFQPE